MRKKYTDQLKQLNEEMVQMSTMIEESIEKAINTLINQDVEQAREIMKNDNLINHEQKKIETICFQLLMQQQPVASDLRSISAAMKMVTDMERIGDHAADICEMTVMMSKHVYLLDLTCIKQMAKETVLMLIQSIESYVDKDIEKARYVVTHDDVVDLLFEKVKKELIGEIQQNPECSEQAADMLMVAKYFERIGDHATNIAEWVIFSLDDRKQE